MIFGIHVPSPEVLNARKDEEPISAHKFRLSNATRLKRYRACRITGHQSFQVGFFPGDWVRCSNCESEFRTVNQWRNEQKERDLPFEEET